MATTLPLARSELDPDPVREQIPPAATEPDEDWDAPADAEPTTTLAADGADVADVDIEVAVAEPPQAPGPGPETTPEPKPVAPVESSLPPLDSAPRRGAKRSRASAKATATAKSPAPAQVRPVVPDVSWVTQVPPEPEPRGRVRLVAIAVAGLALLALVFVFGSAVLTPGGSAGVGSGPTAAPPSLTVGPSPTIAVHTLTLNVAVDESLGNTVDPLADVAIGEPCRPSRDVFPDIREGTVVVVADDAGAILARTVLAGGHKSAPGTCTFSAKASVAEAAAYRIIVGYRAPSVFPLDEVAGNGWTTDVQFVTTP